MSKYTNGQEAAPSSVVEPATGMIKTLLHHYQVGQLDVAEQLACALCQQFPENPFGWKALGTIRQQLGRFKEALEPMLVAVRILPSDAETHCNLGVVLKNLGRFSEAAAHYRDAILLDSNHVGAYNNLGNLLREHKKYPEA
uniref:tetratricopeptide repeat protein n=1 Tax=Flavobacterium sp. TaxID=239 RepID=UPI0037C12DC7